MLRNFNVGTGILASSGWSSSNWIGLPVRAPGYAVVSAQVGYRIDLHWSVMSTLNNALNRTYYQTFAASGRFYGDPRNAIVTFRARY